MKRHEIDYITVRGFKSISSIEKLELGPINVIIGANGSGKSNFLGVFSFLHAIREGRLNSYIREAGGAENVLHFGSKVTKEIIIELSFENQLNQYEIALRPDSEDNLYPDREITKFWDKGKHPKPYETFLPARNGGTEAGISNPKAERIADWIRTRLGRWRLYHFHDTSTSSPLRKTAQLHDNQFLRYDGSNLPSFLYLLKEKYSDSYLMIRKTIRLAIPFFEDFNLVADPLSLEHIRLAWVHKDSDKYFGASALSDGSIRFIALTVLFLQPEEFRPSIIMVDEPELGLHPSAITILASLIKQAAHETQVIVSTQSALLLDHFQPEDILVADRENENTAFHRLDPDDLDKWMDEFSLGQLWEKNHFGGRPK
ncbi:chromosome segregation protein SMC [Leptospira kanakyensis]|uniref:Chromosome segregation protein SMC n=1 Tax=Leptospira kanakyensis TaxID=2484968 RepID=A0A6N4QQG0_9LEPT|nr:AAA family ATPase [Leptospira kanakyensis]TGK55578.1 chromosome segregation protein SMC [Leptospira kanakyensis]TGK61114.1 chromosome segregation protein SMC [Leptospira kanakyensis]TGK76414.1 chromosome segregation protein SMC [Leptospira kanakyensis]